MSEIRVNVEGAPEAVAKFFKEMGQTHFVSVDILEGEEALEEPEAVEVCPVEVKEEKKPRKPRQKKTEEKVVEAEVLVEEEYPDPEFADLPDSEVTPSEDIQSEVQIVKEDGVTEAEPVKLKIQDVKEALKEYGIWIVEQGHESASAKEYLIALLRKFGNDAKSTAELSEEYYEAVFQAAVNRVPKEELEEYK